METQGTDLVSSELAGDEPNVRARIIEVATRMFSELGYSRVSMNEIAQELHLSKKTLYRLFEDKEDLLRAVILPKLQASAAATDSVLKDSDAPYLAKLTRLMQIIAERAAKASSILIRDVYVHAPHVWEEIMKFKRTRYECFESLVSEGIALGVIRHDVPPILISAMYRAVIEGIATPAALAELPYTGEEVSHAIITVLFAGLMTDDARKAFLDNTFLR